MGLFLPDDSVDSIVTDPPYGIRFMGKSWDHGVPGIEFWRAAYAVLKPGGYLLAFGGSRTYHRLASAIEDAGFEIRDQVIWMYGQGMPKSHNLKGHHDGWGTGLKPAHEPLVMARKPFKGTVAKNVTLWGTGAINIDGCRVAASEGVAKIDHQKTDAISMFSGLQGGKAAGVQMDGRWPANIIHDGSEAVVELFPSQAGAAAPVTGTEKSRTDADGTNSNWGYGRVASPHHGDSGSAARFFYVPKASPADRNHGAVNTHTTVKPTDLMAYLCRLVTPPGGTVLDPFMGSGSTGKAALREGFNFIGCELEPEYFAIAQARIAAETK